MNYYYLGLKKKTVENNHFFKKVIVLQGGNKNDICYETKFNKNIDYNDLGQSREVSKFFDEMIKEIELVDDKCKFMLYNQATIEYMNNLENVLCVNDMNLIKNLNNKPKCREILLKEVNVLEYQYLQANDITFEEVAKRFNNKFKKYVVQQPVGFAGVGTFLLTQTNCALKDLQNNVTYSISGYIENGISLNNTFMISDGYIHIFEGSCQKIKADKELSYDGWDFDLYKILSENVKIEIYNQTLKIAKKLQQLGYRGVCGVDYLLKDEIVYFMEINPRFQASSEYLDKMLIKQNLPSIFELNYLAFYNEEQFTKECNIIKEKINE